MMKKHLIFTFALLLPLLCFPQKEKFSVRSGNDAYKDGNYDKAAKSYEDAIERKADYKEAQFNYGNALQRKARDMSAEAMHQENDSLKRAGLMDAMAMSRRAAEAYEKVAGASDTKPEKNKAFYNLGNARLMGGELDKAIESYKESLRNDPTDDDARYNLAYAQWLKKQQEQNQQQDQQDQQQEQQQQQDQQQQDQQQNEEQQRQEKPNELSREEAEKMLDAMMKQEKDLMEKVNKERHKAVRIKIEKDW